MSDGLLSTVHHDPRTGDEGPSTSSSSARQVSEVSHHTTEPRKPEHDSPVKSAPTKSADPPFKSKLPSNFLWIPANWTWSKLKPVIRCALAGWVSVLLMVIQPVLRTMGQAGFLIIIAAFLSPPSDPFIANLERELVLLLFVSMAYAWSCLGIKLASLARTNFVPNASIKSIFSGQYIEAAPSVIMAIFLFFGVVFFLYIKARQGPGPFLFATIFGCICLDISLTTAVFFPYPYYQIGRAVVVPLALHSAVAIITSALIFPSTMSAQYTARFRAVLEPLVAGLHHHRSLLSIPTSSSDFSPAEVIASVAKAEAALAPLAATARLLKRDFSWARYSPTDLSSLRKKLLRMAVRANGMTVYFGLIDPTRERFPMTPAPSRPGTPAFGTPEPSRPPSPIEEKNVASPSTPLTPTATVDTHNTDIEPISPRRARHRHTHFSIAQSPPLTRTNTPTPSLRERSGHRHHHHHHSHLLRELHLSLSHHHQREHVVGVFESQRYLDLESTHFAHPMSSHFTERATFLLKESCDELLEGCANSLKGLDFWLEQSRTNRFAFWRNEQTMQRIHNERLEAIQTVTTNLADILKRFRKDKRHLVVDPYRSAFDPRHIGSITGEDVPPHRYLFHCYVYQYHLMHFSMNLLDLLQEATDLEEKRVSSRLWFPSMPVGNLFTWSIWDQTVDLDREDDENPDIIQGMDSAWMGDLGMAERRDPDALPPRNLFESLMNLLHRMLEALSSGNVLFAIKAGVLTILLSLPSLLQSSASFAYGQRFNWAIFMGQLTIARWRGDTTFGLVARIMSTFLGGIVGSAVWYISTGTGHGSPYGLAATCAVAFPLFFYARLYWPGPPMTNLIFFVTTALTLGYSWQNTHFRVGTFAYYGINLAWRRFVLVAAGVTAAFVFSFLPPSTTLRRYQRNTLATTASEIGTVYCSIVSFANARNTEDTQEIIQSLIAIRMKLKRSVVLRTNIIYEFSLRGRWPAERYHKILEIQLQIAYLLSHLMSVVEHLEPAWSRAFLRRTRFLDADFQGDVLAVISLVSTAIRTGNPLPQITPCPLFDRFIQHQHGLNVIRQEADDDYGLPRTMTIDTLENEQYLCFCVGVSTAFGIVTRLDRLMVATKELVGEQYHIHGVGFVSKTGGVEMSTRTSSLRPGHDA